LSRDIKPLPRMIINQGIKEINDFVFDDFQLEGYDPHPPIKASVAV